MSLSGPHWPANWDEAGASGRLSLDTGVGTAAVGRASPCQACGACCSTSREWPRFSTEDDAALDRIPVEFVDDRQGGMRCTGDRCSALLGEVGVHTACAIYTLRPDVCRACKPGDEACGIARAKWGLSLLLQD